jgi:hypothetical protein
MIAEALDHRPKWPATDPSIRDLRFRTLLGKEAWDTLPPATRERFSKRLGGAGAVTYVGEIVECRMSRAGWLLAQIARLIGGPLPQSRDIGVPAIVSVTEDVATDGQFWTRIYGRADGFPQVIHSSKRFAGCTGLEEYLGRGVGIALAVGVEAGTLIFRSDHFFVRCGRLRFRLPGWLEPGRLTIRHVDQPGGAFAFGLVLEHPRFGEIICQTGLFCEHLAPAPGRANR